MTWVLLGIAIVSEVSASLALQAAVDRPAWYGVVVLAYAASFGLLSLVLRRGMPLGVAYGIWSALGVASTAVLATLLFGEVMTGWKAAGITLVILGVLAVELGSRERAAVGPVPGEGAR